MKYPLVFSRSLTQTGQVEKRNLKTGRLRSRVLSFFFFLEPPKPLIVEPLQKIKVPRKGLRKREKRSKVSLIFSL